MCVIDCVLVGLDWAEPMMQFLLHVTRSCIPHAYILFLNILDIFEFFGAFLIVYFFSLSILFTLVMSMAPKHKSTPARNPLHFNASSSFDSAPLSLQFHDDDAHNAFSENFSRRSIHSKRQGILVDFTNTNLPTVIHSQG